MITFNIICAIIFVAFWIVAMIKGEAFLALPLGKRLAIAGAAVVFMLGWIITDHIVLGV